MSRGDFITRNFLVADIDLVLLVWIAILRSGRQTAGQVSHLQILSLTFHLKDVKDVMAGSWLKHVLRGFRVLFLVHPKVFIERGSIAYILYSNACLAILKVNGLLQVGTSREHELFLLDDPHRAICGL